MLQRALLPAAASILLACLCPSPANADQATPPSATDSTGIDKSEGMPSHARKGRETWNFYLEQDVFASNNEDRNYTMGVGVEWINERRGTILLTTPQKGVMKGIEFVGLWNRSESQASYMRSLAFGSTNYTPDSLRAVDALSDQRPYASVVYLSSTLTRVDHAHQRAMVSRLAIGMLGLSIAKNFQTKWHQFLRSRSGKETPYDPQGWHNQISDGGELTGLFTLHALQLVPWLSRDCPLVFPGFAAPFRSELVVGGGGSAGYYTDVDASVRGRIGIFESGFWEFTDTPMPNKLRAERPFPIEAFVFAGIRERYVFYNALLQGQTGHYADAYNDIEIERWVPEWNWGWSLGLQWCKTWYSLSWINASRKPEITAVKRTHKWASINFSFTRMF